jgi:hypothetical protein
LENAINHVLVFFQGEGRRYLSKKSGGSPGVFRLEKTNHPLILIFIIIPPRAQSPNRGWQADILHQSTASSHGWASRKSIECVRDERSHSDIVVVASDRSWCRAACAGMPCRVYREDHGRVQGGAMMGIGKPLSSPPEVRRRSYRHRDPCESVEKSSGGRRLRSAA